MGWGILAMSQAEPERAFLMRQIVQRLVSQKAVAERLGIGVRQVKRLVQAWRQDADARGGWCRASAHGSRHGA